jgi:hypothetical protein
MIQSVDRGDFSIAARLPLFLEEPKSAISREEWATGTGVLGWSRYANMI